MAYSADPYASHLPLLVELAKVFDIASVLEFGGGEFSTEAFLNRDLFPDLHRLDCVETDKRWNIRIGEKYRDPRLFMLSQYPGWPVAGYSLVFIDDGPSEIERVITMNRVAAEKSPLVVIHDTEVEAYRGRLHLLFDNHVTHDVGPGPSTSVAWPDPLATARIARLMSVLVEVDK